MEHSATYSPDDNKLRIYPAYRLDREDYLRLKSAGFKWAPKQELFVAPMWTPEREDICFEFCGEIEDEDTSLVDRAEIRAERFGDYSEKRATEADQANAYVKSIADNIPFGQPILVGHHSERRARKDAERIETGMRKAVKLWDTSRYWQVRVEGALRHAKYKERPDVRHRRIKKLESELRVIRSKYTPDPKTAPIMQCAFDHTTGKSEIEPSKHVWCGLGRGGHWVKEDSLEKIKVHYTRWEAHLENRIIYEKAMLDDQGGLASDIYDIKPGGMVLVKGEWLTVIRVNRSNGVINSVTTAAPRVVNWTDHWKYGIEDVKDYRQPTEEQTQKVKAAVKAPPLCNYKIDGCAEITKKQWKGIYTDHKRTVIIKGDDTRGEHRLRHVDNFVARKFGVDTNGKQWGSWPVFISDMKEKLPPKPETEKKVTTADLPRDSSAGFARLAPKPTPEPTEFDAMKETLRNGGVKAVTAPQLFPTPIEIARRMVKVADIQELECVLEPSAGTGNIVAAINETCDVFLTACELSRTLAYELDHGKADKVHCGNFLEANASDLYPGEFKRIIMNPPFENGVDIKHIKHALNFLSPGGRLVALCADGPRQQAQLKPMAEASGGWYKTLPAGSFREAGTAVSVAMLVVEKG